METFQEQQYSKSAYQKHLEDEELGVSVYAMYTFSTDSGYWIITYDTDEIISFCF